MTRGKTVQVLPSVVLIHDTCLKRWVHPTWYLRERIYIRWRWPTDKCR